MLNLLYLTFGDNIENHYQANFSILSFLRDSKKINSINVVTDQPHYYSRYGEKIQIIEIDKQTLEHWQGETGFFWRIKLKALELMVDKYQDGSIVYLDSDTFLHRDLDLLEEKIKSGVAFMHENEGSLSALTTKTERLMWKQVEGRRFGGVTITSAHAMWNAGVVILPKEKKSLAIKLALSICDDMCNAGVTRRLIEQFALSIALKETYTLEAAEEWIGHYWGNKSEWNTAICNFFTDTHLKKMSVQQEIEYIQAFDFFSLAIRKRRSSVYFKLLKMVGNLYPVKGVKYVNG
jgi:hypothetical protein